MKTVWGLLLIGFGLLNVSFVHAKDWTPFVGVSLLPNMNAIYSEFDARENHKETAQIIASTNGSLLFNFGYERDHLSILVRYYLSGMPAVWSELTDKTTNVDGSRLTETYQLREWREYYLAGAVRYYPRLPETAKSKFYCGAGVGIGRTGYRDRFISDFVNRYDQYSSKSNDFVAESWYFFKQYAEAGISAAVAKDINLIFGCTLQHAMVPLDQIQLNPYIHNNVENWVVGLEIGFLYYYR